MVATSKAGLGKEFLPIIKRFKRGKLTQSGLVVTKDPVCTCPDCPLSAKYSGRGAVTVRLEYEGKVYGVRQMLKGYRNRPPARLERFEEILIRLSQLVIDFPEIAELDINPMILAKDQACALDAWVIIKQSQVSAPQHLAISPY